MVPARKDILKLTVVERSYSNVNDKSRPRNSDFVKSKWDKGIKQKKNTVKLK